MKTFITDCVHSTGEKISAMVERSKEITYKTFMKQVDREEIKEMFPFYSWNGYGGLKLKDDWAVSYYKSTYEKKACVYIEHSRIEYIFN